MSEHPEDALEALRRWCPDDPVTIERPASGTMSETFIVHLPDAVMVLRGHRHRDRRLVEFEHHVMQMARARGIPAPRGVRTPIGEDFVDVAGRHWSLLEWIPGEQPVRGGHSPEQAASMGRALARIHLALAGLSPAEEATTPPDCASDTVQRIGRLVEVIEDRAGAGEDEELALAWLRGQREWLTEVGDHPLPAARHTQVVHGDYHDANVVFAGAEVVGVLDWDKAGAGECGEEVIRAMHLSFALDPDRSRAFLAGYRSERPIGDDDLVVSAERYGYHRDRSIWLFEELYRRGNERLRPLLNRSGFVPFERAWADAGVVERARSFRQRHSGGLGTPIPGALSARAREP